ncbi:hypothetical protein CZ771_10425 [Actinomycetales bacterium JB111]|nr:hypothetical protein CZ771_10425 [Actinomycetales bacterium JB111]
MSRRTLATTGTATARRTSAHSTTPRRSHALPAFVALAGALALAGCGSGDSDDDGEDDPIADGSVNLVPTDESDALPSWLEEPYEPRDSSSGLCTDVFAQGLTEITTTELAACQAESLSRVEGYVQTINGGTGQGSVMRVSNGDVLAVDADFGLQHVRVVGNDWWASEDGEQWMTPDEIPAESDLSGVEYAATSLQGIHDPQTAASSTMPFDTTVVGSATVDGEEVAILTGFSTGQADQDLAVTYYVDQNYVVRIARTQIGTGADDGAESASGGESASGETSSGETSSGGASPDGSILPGEPGPTTPVTTITELGEPQDVTAPE